MDAVCTIRLHSKHTEKPIAIDPPKAVLSTSSLSLHEAEMPSIVEQKQSTGPNHRKSKVCTTSITTTPNGHSPLYQMRSAYVHQSPKVYRPSFVEILLKDLQFTVLG